MKLLSAFVAASCLLLASTAEASFDLRLEVAGSDFYVAAPGETITVDVILEATSAVPDIFSYQLSVGYDASELSFVSVSHTGVAPLITFGAPSNVGSVVGSFDATSFSSALATGSYSIGTIDFLVGTPVNDGVDVSFSTANVLDNANAPLTGSTGGLTVAVPEPSSLAVLGLTAGGLLVRRRRKA